VRRRRTWQLRAVVVSAAAFTLAATGTAWAAWTCSGTGSAAGLTATMPVGSQPTAGAAGTTVTVTWPAVDILAGTPVQGYVVSRTNADTGGPGSVGSGCSGVITTTTCTDTGVPPGDWEYFITPVQDSWTGSTGPPSATVSVSSPLT